MKALRDIHKQGTLFRNLSKKTANIGLHYIELNSRIHDNVHN